MWCVYTYIYIYVCVVCLCMGVIGKVCGMIVWSRCGGVYVCVRCV